MNRLLTAGLLSLALLLSACDFVTIFNKILEDEATNKPPEPKPKERKMFTGKKETKYGNGQVKTSIEYKDGKRHGEAIQYYPNGNVHLSDTYIFGDREGVSKYYYQNGNIYRETDYIADRRNGWKKEYTKSGRLKYKAGYEKGEPTGEFIEYDLDGKAKPQPKIRVKPLGWNSSHTAYRYEVSFDQTVNSPKFYLGDPGDRFSFSNSVIADVKEGKGYIELRVPKGKQVDTRGQFVGQATNRYKYPLTATKTLNISLKNP